MMLIATIDTGSLHSLCMRMPINAVAEASTMSLPRAHFHAVFGEYAKVDSGGAPTEIAGASLRAQQSPESRTHRSASILTRTRWGLAQALIRRALMPRIGKA